MGGKYFLGKEVCSFSLTDLETNKSILFQTDYDYPGLAINLGIWQPCHNTTDGTIDCPTCGKTASQLIHEAYEALMDRIEEEFNFDFYLEYDFN